MPKMQFSMGRKCMLQPLDRYDVKPPLLVLAASIDIAASIGTAASIDTAASIGT